MFQMQKGFQSPVLRPIAIELSVCFLLLLLILHISLACAYTHNLEGYLSPSPEQDVSPRESGTTGPIEMLLGTLDYLGDLT